MQSPPDPEHCIDLGLMNTGIGYLISQLNDEERKIIQIRLRDFTYPRGFHKLDSSIFEQIFKKGGKVTQPMNHARSVT